jgi:hypothetical protein
MVNLWRLFQGNGYGAGHLADSGGILDQAAIMMDAFALMNNIESTLSKRKHGA